MAKKVENPGVFLAYMLAKYKLDLLKFSGDICLRQPAIRLIIEGKAKITVPVAMRLAKYFNTNPEFWLAMQMRWDVAKAGRDKALMKAIKNISRVSKGTASSVRITDSTAKEIIVKKKAAAKNKKTIAAGKPVTKKMIVASKKPVTGKKTATARKRVAKRRVVAAKKPVSRKQTVAARKKVTVEAQKKTSVRRGRPVKKQ